MSPALIADTDPDMRINQEEVFGPVVSTVRVKDYEAALALANQGNFGLSAGIVTTSLKQARHLRRTVRAGQVMVNLPTEYGRASVRERGGQTVEISVVAVTLKKQPPAIMLYLEP